jgi:hypothetical protein
VGLMSDSDCEPGITGDPKFDRLYRSSREPMIRLARLLGSLTRHTDGCAGNQLVVVVP